MCLVVSRSGIGWWGAGGIWVSAKRAMQRSVRVYVVRQM